MVIKQITTNANKSTNKWDPSFSVDNIANCYS